MKNVAFLLFVVLLLLIPAGMTAQVTTTSRFSPSWT
jgi:hypothetical protein